ncbi:hypothetical protein EYC84_005984 [Monilinia fructicola]|uniref:Uncharacterized protein n=1 Tax=Monilinia fructicola TaxID=38448 RepID=A0A5M9K3E1_MONFR|nr:hypothetical protein EYC84_005984 [Monilinia fructicola]
MIIFATMSGIERVASCVRFFYKARREMNSRVAISLGSLRTKVMNTLYLVNNFGDPLGGGFSFVDMKFPELTIFIRSELYCHVHRVRLFFPFKITGLYRKGP